MKKDMPLEGLRWSRDSGSALYDTPPKRPFSDGLGGEFDPFKIRVVQLLSKS